MRFSFLTLVSAVFLLSSSFVYADGVDSSPNVDLPISAGGTRSLTIKANTGYVGVGTDTPNERLEVAGGLKLGLAGECTVAKAGVIQWNAAKGKFEGCNGTQWGSLGATTIKTQQVYCSAGYEGSYEDYGCKASCPDGTTVVGGGFQWGAVNSSAGRLAMQDGNGYHCLINVQSCSSGDGGCNSGCYAICASLVDE